MLRKKNINRLHWIVANPIGTTRLRRSSVTAANRETSPRGAVLHHELLVGQIFSWRQHTCCQHLSWILNGSRHPSKHCPMPHTRKVLMYLWVGFRQASSASAWRFNGPMPNNTGVSMASSKDIAPCSAAVSPAHALNWLPRLTFFQGTLYCYFMPRNTCPKHCQCMVYFPTSIYHKN